MLCPILPGGPIRTIWVRIGTVHSGYRCDACKKCFTDEATRPHDHRKVGPSQDVRSVCVCSWKAIQIRSVERSNRGPPGHVIDAMVAAGEKCHRFMRCRDNHVPVANVQG